MDNFNELYMCNFEPSRLDVLTDRIVEYYKVTEGMTRKEIAKERMKLTVWSRSHGYNAEDFQQAKNIASGIRY